LGDLRAILFSALPIARIMKHVLDEVTQPSPRQIPQRYASTCRKQAEDIIKALEREEGRKLTQQEINLSLAQARVLGEL
jgi:hypothetical protein